MFNIFKRFLKEEKAQGTTEYMLVLGLVVGVVIAVGVVFKDRFKAMIGKLIGKIGVGMDTASGQ